MRLNLKFLPAFLLLYCLSGCELLDRLHDVKPHRTEVTEFAAQLKTPFGIEVDSKKQVWVAEAGTGEGTSGRISLITPQGAVYPAVTGFPSLINPEGTPFGLAHLALQGDILWVLHSPLGRLYRFDTNDFHIGDEPIDASELAYEDIGAFIRSYPFKVPLEHINPYNLTVGPGGDLFIVEAEANAIIRRQAGSGELSVFAIFPDLPNPTPVGPPTIDAVPTGIVYDGHKLLVSSLTGFPFLAQKANIYRVDQAGNVSVYQSGFTNLTDIALGLHQQPLALEYATFSPESGFAPNTGRLVAANKTSIRPILPALNFPTAIERSDWKTYYIGSSAEGKIYKLTHY